MYCPACGKQMEEGNRFCTECGAAIRISPRQSPQTEQPRVVQTQAMRPQPAKMQAAPVSQRKPGRKKKLLYIMIVILVLALAVAAAFFGYRMYQKSYANDQVELGQSYLLDQNYEEAIVAFTNALKCEPKNAEMYERLVDAYIEWADYVIETKQDYEEAVDILSRGLEQTGDDRLEDYLKEYKEYRKMQTKLTGILDRIARLCNDSDYEEIFAYMQSDEYAYLIENVKQLKETFITDTAYGRMGIYRVKTDKYGNYMLYYGDFVSRKDAYVREGFGVWLGYYEGNNCLVIGEWENDKPNGRQTMREWNSGLAEDVTYRVVQGNAVDGLWDGSAQWSFERDSGETDMFDVTFHNGVAAVLRMSASGEHRYVIGENSNGSGGELSINDSDEVFSITGF